MVDKINTVKATSEWTFPPIRAIARSVRNEEMTDGGGRARAVIADRSPNVSYRRRGQFMFGAPFR